MEYGRVVRSCNFYRERTVRERIANGARSRTQGPMCLEMYRLKEAQEAKKEKQNRSRSEKESELSGIKRY